MPPLICDHAPANPAPFIKAMPRGHCLRKGPTRTPQSQEVACSYSRSLSSKVTGDSTKKGCGYRSARQRLSDWGESGAPSPARCSQRLELTRIWGGERELIELLNMCGAEGLSDETVRGAVSGVMADRERVAEALLSQVRLMVAARLSPNPGRFDVLDDIAQIVMVAVAESLPRLENRTVGGLRALVSVIVQRRVADFLRGRNHGSPNQRPMVSLETTITDASQVGPLWQFLSAGGLSPSSAAGQSDQISVVLTALGQLKSEYREVIALALIDQLATSEIARQLGVSRRAASMLLLRAIRSLREQVLRTSEFGGTGDGPDERHEG